MVLDEAHHVRKLEDLGLGEQVLAHGDGIGETDVLDFIAFFAQQIRREKLFRNRGGLRISDQVFTQLGIHVITQPFRVVDVLGDGHAVDLFIAVVGVDQHAHGRGEMVDAIEVTLLIGPIRPQARPDLFHALGHVSLVGMVRVGIVQTRAVELGQVFIVGAGTASQRRVGVELFMQVLEALHHPHRQYALLADLFSKRVQGGHPVRRVRLEIWILDHELRHRVQVVVLHEGIVKIEGHGKSRGGHARRQAAIQLRHIGGLGTKGIGVFEPNIRQGRDLRDLQVSRRILRFCRADGVKVGIDVLVGRGCQFQSVGQDLEFDILPLQCQNVGVCGGVLEIRIGCVVLLGLDIDVRQGGLRCLRDDAGHVTQRVGQRLEDDNVSHGHAVCIVHNLEQAITLARIQGTVSHIGIQVFSRNHGQTGLCVQSLFLLVDHSLCLARRMVEELAHGKRHVR